MNHNHVDTFSIPLLLILLPAILIAAIVIGWKKMNESNRTSSLLAVLLLIIAMSYGLPFSNHYPMSMHMVQHIILLIILPPLVWNTLPKEELEKWIQNKTFHKIFKLLSNPVIAYSIGMIVMWIVNIPMLKGSAASKHHHVAASAGLFSLPEYGGLFIFLQLLAGLIYSLPVFSPVEQSRVMPLQGIIYLFLSCLGCSILGIFITLNPAHAGSIDLQTSGLIMWIPGCFIYISKALIILIAFFRSKKLAETY